MKNSNVITVFGATGFIGSEVVRVLAGQGYILRLPCAHVKKADFLKVNGNVGQIIPMAIDGSDEALNAAIRGASVVVNCTGILTETKRRTFINTHCTLPERIGKLCKKNNVSQFIHISALGVDRSQSDYGQSKLAGEKAIMKAFDRVTILRPSIVFGTKDSFFNMFAGMAKTLPFLPLIGGGKTMFQPIYVGDVANAVSAAIKKQAFGIYELGGPEQASFKSLLEKMMGYTGQKRPLVAIPFGIANLQATFMRILPHPPLTTDQVKSLKTDNIVNDHAMTLSDLGITPTSMNAILPTYLGRSS